MTLYQRDQMMTQYILTEGLDWLQVRRRESSENEKVSPKGTKQEEMDRREREEKKKRKKKTSGQRTATHFGCIFL